MPDFPQKRVSIVGCLKLLALILFGLLFLALLFPSSHGHVGGQAMKAQAKNDILGIIAAITQYHKEYGKYPPGGDGALPLLQSSIPLMRVLRGQDPLFNPKRIVFLDGKEAEMSDSFFNKKLCSGFDPVTGALLDPWGNAYHVIYRPDSSGHIASPYSDEAPIAADVIAWSIGKDGIQSATRHQNSKDSDDIVSWP